MLRVQGFRVFSGCIGSHINPAAVSESGYRISDRLYCGAADFKVWFRNRWRKRCKGYLIVAGEFQRIVRDLLRHDVLSAEVLDIETVVYIHTHPCRIQVAERARVSDPAARVKPIFPVVLQFTCNQVSKVLGFKTG